MKRSQQSGSCKVWDAMKRSQQSGSCKVWDAMKRSQQSGSCIQHANRKWWLL